MVINFIPPASPLNAAWLVKRFENIVTEIGNTIKEIDKDIFKDGKTLKYNNEFRCKQKNYFDNLRFGFQQKIRFYKTYYPEYIFNQYYNLKNL